MVTIVIGVWLFYLHFFSRPTDHQIDGFLTKSQNIGTLHDTLSFRRAAFILPVRTIQYHQDCWPLLSLPKRKQIITRIFRLFLSS